MGDNVTKLILERVENLLIENRVSDVKSKYPPVDHITGKIDEIASKDPSGNHKYLDWLCKQLLRPIKWFKDNKSSFNNREFTNPGDWNNIYSGYFEYLINDRDRSKLYDNIEYFQEHPTKFEKKDINQYKTVNELDEAVETAKQKLTRKEEKDAGIDKIFEDDNFLLIAPKTHKASCRYGSNTKWCITMRGYTGYFENYMTSGLVFFLIDKRRLEPTRSMTTQDYYKIAFQYRPFGAGLRTDGSNAKEMAQRMGREEFIKGADLNNSIIEYWNVQDHNKPESVVRKYIGGPGKGQSQRADYYMPLLKQKMSDHVKGILTKYFDSLGNNDYVEKIRRLERELNDLSSTYNQMLEKLNKIENLKTAIRYIGDLEGTIFEKYRGVGTEELNKELQKATEESAKIANDFSAKRAELETEKKKMAKKLTFYDVERSVPQK